jgi:glycerophosphoryl diester phosphodiesterase
MLRFAQNDRMPLWLDPLVLRAVDALFALAPARLPPRDQLTRCRIISHRGERDDRAVFENTFAAFDPLRGTGVYGIEFDVRWTRDLVPVVFHDADLLRLFGDPTSLRDVTWAELRERRPEIPDLHGFVRRYAADFHLMAEVKHEHYPYPARQSALLAAALAPALAAGRCTVLSLVPEMFGWLPDIPAGATMGIARLNTADISAESLAAGRFGCSGHYALIGRRRIEAHHAAGQSVGVGFPASRSVLYREVARGVDYVFTNLAREAEGWRREALAQHGAAGTPAPPG